ncbi:MAG: DUF5043 domain-containing protein [Dysgonamonadaceae bacterium]|jgi:hypothetical protein|nr:DUF5043 domain-containing protein [Dysgonamonadaceae bacterium]
MKTKIFLFIAVCLLSVSGMTAQSRPSDATGSRDRDTGSTYYYKETKTFYENGYTYQCDVENAHVTLYNKANRFTYVKQTFKDGSPLSKELFDGDVDVLEDDTWTKPKCNSILSSAFLVTRMGSGHRIFVTMYIDPNTGKVMEVDFWFDTNKEFGTVSISVYREIELALKNDVWFKPTAEGKKLNYIMRGWMHEVKGVKRATR